MGDNGIPDHVAALKQLAVRYPMMDLDRTRLENEPAEAPVVDAADVLTEVWVPGMLAEAIARLQRKHVN